MSDLGLRPDELECMCTVFRAAPDVAEVRLYGSRAKGTSQPASDIDLALVGVRTRCGPRQSRRNWKNCPCRTDSM
jgi:predicted nucleotidyltransferase